MKDCNAIAYNISKIIINWTNFVTFRSYGVILTNWIDKISTEYVTQSCVLQFQLLALIRINWHFMKQWKSWLISFFKLNIFVLLFVFKPTWIIYQKASLHFHQRAVFGIYEISMWKLAYQSKFYSFHLIEYKNSRNSLNQKRRAKNNCLSLFC